MPNWLRHRYGELRFRLVDWICLGYMALIGVLVLIFHQSIAGWPIHIAIHLLLIVAGLEIIRLGERHAGNGWLWFLRTFYPVIFILYGWDELNHLVLMAFDSFWLTDFLVQADVWLFGAHPTVWVEQYYLPWLDELVSVLNVSYYLFIPIATLPLFFSGKREATLAAFAIASLTYFTNLLLFYLLPSVCPRMIADLTALHAFDYSGYVFADLVRFFQRNASVQGGCFPSSHVSMSFAWAFAAWRYHRPLAYVLLPMAIGVAISTVYLRYHHAVDPIVGLLLAVFCTWLAIWLLQRRGEDPVE